MKFAIGKWICRIFGIALVGVAGCSSHQSQAPNEGSAGAVELALSFDSGASVTGVTYLLTGPNGYSSTGSLQSTTRGVVTVASGLIPDVPRGTGYILDVTTTSSDGTTCEGKSRPLKVVCSDNDRDDADHLLLVCRGGSRHLTVVAVSVNLACRTSDAGIDAQAEATVDARAEAAVDATVVPDAESDAGPEACVPTTCAASNVACGPLADGCGGTLQCGSCPTGQSCDSAGQCVCQPATACPAGQNCGTAPDGCGGTLQCGTCTGTNTCGGGGVMNQCGCTPATTCPAGQQCGTAPNGCGGSVTCAACPAGTTCNSSNQCGCVPQTACTGGQVCGSQDNGCGGTTSCGTCPTGTNCDATGQCVATCPTTCSAGAVCGTQSFSGCPSVNCGTCPTGTSCDASNHCICVPATTCPAGQQCGMALDGCGGVINCPACPAGTTCNSSNQCVCVPRTVCAGGQQCGIQDNGCGGMVSCGTCPSGQVCDGSNVCVCQPATACPAGQICGTAPNGCGGTLTCGTCPAGTTCNGGTSCDTICVPKTACTGGQNCGTQDNGCGGTLNCGACTAPDTCGGGGQPGICGHPAVNACAAFNAGAACTPTEQRFVDKSPDCYSCMANAGCLNDALFGDTGHECSDVTGTAVRGGATGVSRTQLCLDTLDCILVPPSCASADVAVCYCGSLGAGNACSTALAGAPDGKCLTQELNGLEHLVTDAPSVVLPDFTSQGLGAGIANQLFNCAKANGCDTLCSQ